MKKIILLLLLFVTGTLSQLTAEEEQRLILASDTSVIDEKLRELPGGILMPPGIAQLPVPTMDPALPPLIIPQQKEIYNSISLMEATVRRAMWKTKSVV